MSKHKKLECGDCAAIITAYAATENSDGKLKLGTMQTKFAWLLPAPAAH